MPEQNFEEFYISLNNELEAVKNRVRNLIGNKNWGEDGRYREAVLKNVISRFLPQKYSIGTGFAINKKKQITRQLDLIIYDSSYPILFSEGDFVVVLADSVKAIIEVKSKISNTTDLINIIKTCEENARKIDIDFPLAQRMFNGLFSYECSLSFNALSSALINFFELTECDVYRKVTNMSLGNEKFLHVWWSQRPFSLRGYELSNLSFAYFISNLLTSLDPNLLLGNDSLFFPFKSKTPFEKFNIQSPPGKWERHF